MTPHIRRMHHHHHHIITTTHLEGRDEVEVERQAGGEPVELDELAPHQIHAPEQ
jgi:hypothetical protein